MALDAVRAGKHVLVEKPLTTRWEHALALQDDLKESSATFMALPFVDDPHFLAALQFAREEYIGKITGHRGRPELSRPAALELVLLERGRRRRDARHDGLPARPG